MRPVIFLIILALVLPSCRHTAPKAESAWSDLPGVTNLDRLKQTNFVPTLENPISDSNNVIYTSSFLYAWDIIKKELKSDIETGPTNSPDFKWLTASGSYKNALTDKEYDVTANKDANGIRVRAFFRKVLPLDFKMQVSDSPLIFHGGRVSAFGMYYFDREPACILY